MKVQAPWVRAARQRRRRVLLTVVLASLLLLLSAFVAASRWELYRDPRLVGPAGGRLLVAGYASPLAVEPSFVLAWEGEKGTWSALERIPGGYRAADYFEGLLYVFFDDRSYSSYRGGAYVERRWFPFPWVPAEVVTAGEEMVAVGGEGEAVIRAARYREGDWQEGPTLAAGVKRVANLQAAAADGEVMVGWQEEAVEGKVAQRGLFVAALEERGWGAVEVVTLSEVENFALGRAADGEVLLITSEPDPAKGGARRLWERRGRGGTWVGPQPVELSGSASGGRVLDFSLARDTEEPLLVVSQATRVEGYRRRGEAWGPVETLVIGGAPGGVGAGGWLLVSVGALVVLGVGGALVLARAGSGPQAGLHSEIAYASLLERGAACGFDLVSIFFLVMVVSGAYEPETNGFVTVAGHILYATLFEAYWGKTLGKKLVGIVVVTPRLEAIGLGRSALRNLARVVDGLLMYLVGAVLIILSRRRQRFGDRVAGTVVLRESALMVPRAETVGGEAEPGPDEDVQ